jgi:hypothetical protein
MEKELLELVLPSNGGGGIKLVAKWGRGVEWSGVEWSEEEKRQEWWGYSTVVGSGEE